MCEMPVCVMWHEVLLKGSQGKARQAGRQASQICVSVAKKEGCRRHSIRGRVTGGGSWKIDGKVAAGFAAGPPKRETAAIDDSRVPKART
jgi:hypothetical protein